MYMSLKVLEALDVLRNAAGNDFERHRLDILINDLTAPPRRPSKSSTILIKNSMEKFIIAIKKANITTAVLVFTVMFTLIIMAIF